MVSLILVMMVSGSMFWLAARDPVVVSVMRAGVLVLVVKRPYSLAYDSLGIR